MRTAAKKKVIAKSVKLAPKKTIVKKAIGTNSKPKEIKLTTPLTSPALAIPESSKTKQSQLIALLKDPRGASIPELIIATGWQAHSLRGVISGVLRNRLKMTVMSEVDHLGVRRYRIVNEI